MEKLFTAISLNFQLTNIWQVPVIFRIIKAVSHQKSLFHDMAGVADVDFFFPPFLFVDKSANLNRFRSE
jgi:hypothetical protein